MAQPHLAPGALGHVRPLGDALTGNSSHALFKSEQLQVMRLVLHAGTVLPQHAVPGEITLQCIEGAVDLEAGDAQQRMAAGDFVHLLGGVAHEITALQDSSLLVTVCLQPAS